MLYFLVKFEIKLLKFCGILTLGMFFCLSVKNFSLQHPSLQDPYVSPFWRMVMVVVE